MLPKRIRIPRKDFATVFGEKRFFQSPHFSLRVGVSKTDVRAAVSVSKKVSKSAVSRNAIRRRAYSSLSPLLSSLQSGNYLFSAKKGADKVTGESLSQELSELLKPFERR